MAAEASNAETAVVAVGAGTAAAVPWEGGPWWLPAASSS